MPRYANTHTESHGTGLQTTRFREDARAADHPRGRRRRRHRRSSSPAPARTGRDRQADRHPRPAHPGRPRPPLPAARPRSRASSGRSCSSARTSTTPTSCRGASRSPTSSRSTRTPTATSTSPTSRAELDQYADRPLKIGSFCAASNVTGIVTDTARHLPAAAPARRALVLGLRRRGAVRRHRDERRRRRPGRPQGRVFLSPHKFIGGPGTPGVLVVSRELLTNGCRTWSAAAPSPTSTRRSTATSPTPSTARRAARPRSSSRSAPGSCSSSRRRSASDASARARRTSCAARSPPGARTRPSRSSATPTPSGCRSCRSWSATERPLPAPQLRGRAAQRPVRHPVARRLLVRRPVRPPPARHRPRALARVRARDHRRLRGHQARLGARELQLLHQRGGVPVPRATRSSSWPSTAGSSLPHYRFDPTTGLWRHRAGPVEPPLRLPDLRYDADGGSPTRAAPPRAGDARSPATSTRRGALRALPAPIRRRRPAATGSAPTSSTCAGSTCPRSAWSPLRRCGHPAAARRLTGLAASRCGHRRRPSSASASAVPPCTRCEGSAGRLAGRATR